MGKATGFLEYDRVVNPSVAPDTRIQNFNEFHPSLSRQERREQGARCMNCGIPFCQSAVAFGKGPGISGCPLHNLIPEWNDEVYKDQWSFAAKRLLKTNNFPEFTGRVCPALCEAACTCGMNGEPVTVRENELAVIETAFQEGTIQPRIPKVRSGKHVAVVGSGPAGLAAADNLNQRGHKVTVFEREDRIGGLLMYGIPNMKLEKPVIERRVALLKKEGIEFRTGVNVGVDLSAEELLASYDAVVLACGAKQPRALNAGEEGVHNVHYAVDFLTDTTKALIRNQYDLSALQSDRRHISARNKRVVIVGGGDTGNDCVGTCIREGCKSVLQLEMMPKPPETRLPDNPWPEWPMVLKTDYGQQESIAVFGKDPRVYQTTVRSVNTDEKGKLKSIVTVQLEFQYNEKAGRKIPVPVEGTEKTVPCDLLLIAAGFLGCESYTAEAFGVRQTPRTVVETEPGHYTTSVEKVFTAGDMHRGQSLVVWAIAEGRACAAEVDEFLMGYSFL
ncbi:MAG: glutamate synthase subunit beta [Clostridia bacterium]|nr:glutamate synthase subunit beta [Clostridia bacterium]